MSIHLRSLDLNLLPVFDVLMTEQNMTRAAAKLHMSQPAVSNALKRLRTTYDDELFVRTAKGIRPTERAQALHQSVQSALANIQAGFNQTPFDYRTSAQHFSLAMTDAAEATLMPVLMQWLRKNAPEVRLQVQPDEPASVSELLRNGVVDISVDYLPRDNRHFVSQVVGEEKLVVVVGSQHQTLKKSITKKQFASLPQVGLLQNDPLGSPMERLARPQKLHRNIFLRVAHLTSVAAIVARTDMIGVIPARMAAYYCGKWPLRSIALPMDFPKVTIALTWHRSQDTNPANRWLREQIIALYPQLD